MSGGFTYGPIGATCPAHQVWAAQPLGFRRFEQTVPIGRGDAVWQAAAAAVLEWGTKRRSGFRVSPAGRVSVGADYRITAGWGPARVHEPVRVVDVVDTADRAGFAYGTLSGHPVSGEEAFVVHRDADGNVYFTLRSLTRQAPRGPWRMAFPLLLIVQRYFRRRYLRALP